MRQQCRLVTLFLLFGVIRGQFVHFVQSDYGNLNESDYGFVTLAVEKVGETDEPFSVIIEVDGADDFSSSAWPLFFPTTLNHSDTRVVDVTVFNDDLPENDETFVFTLRSTSSSISVDEPSTTRVTIPANDDPNGIVGFASTSTIYVEEESGENRTITISLIRQRGTFNDVSVTYEITQLTSGGSELPVDDDLFPAGGEVIFDDGENKKDLIIFVKDDKVPENEEEFVLRLVEGNNGLEVNKTLNEVNIVVGGNDSPIRFSQKVYNVDETSRFVSIKVFRGMDEGGQQRVGPDDSVVSVDYEVVGNTATPGVDYIVPGTKIVRFEEGGHESTLQIFLVDDDDPELAENFTVRLLDNTIHGNAIVAQPMTCTVVIEMNDKANGVVAIDFSQATFDANEDKKAFVFDADENSRFHDIALIRHGGMFQRISVDWKLTCNSTDDVIDDITPVAGTVYLDANQTTSSIEFEAKQDETPTEALSCLFSLLPSTLSGGAELDSPSEAIVFLADTYDVYGVVEIDEARSMISVDENRNSRKLSIEIVREGGRVGEVEVFYSSSYIPRGENEAMPGILDESNGRFVFVEGQESHRIEIEIKEDAFLELDSHFLFQLNNVKLVDRKPLIPPKTPRISTQNITLQITSSLANGEVGFKDVEDIRVDEPLDVAGPLTVVIKLHREGLSGEANVELSYRSIGDRKAEVGSDFTPGPDNIFMAPGQSEVSIEITILPDDLPELEEIITVRLDSVTPNNQKLKRSSIEKQIVIVENDSPGGVFQFDEQLEDLYVIEENESQSVIVTIQRERGDLANRHVLCDVIPDGGSQFYGVPRELVFRPGKRFEAISLIPKDDEIPELDLNYTIVLREYGNPASVLGERTSIHVTILGNDEPHGVFEFADEGGKMLTRQSIGESKGSTSFVASYSVKRNRGTYGHVTVDWKLLPGETDDVTPTSGTLEFADGQSEGIITLQSLSDDIPEPMEEFTIFLHNATMGADVGLIRNASLIIKPNDKAIYFKGDENVDVREGEDLMLTIHREATGSDQTSIRFRTFVINNDSTVIPATPGKDFDDVTTDDVTNMVEFLPGVLDVRISVHVTQDEDPEDDEVFYVELFGTRGDYVTYGNTRIRATIVQNDNANGVFKFDAPYDITMKEGISQTITIMRSRGEFGDVDVHWKIIRHNDSTSDVIMQLAAQEQASDEFVENEGIVSFVEGQSSGELVLTPKSDSIPEYDEDFVLVLLNVSNGKPRLSSNTSELLVKIKVEINDFPKGWISVGTSHAEIAEDVEKREAAEIVENTEEKEIQEMRNHTIVEVERRMGTDGNVKTLWEIYPANEIPAFRCKDLLLSSTPHGGAVVTTGREHSDTFAMKFQKGSFVVVGNSDQPSFQQSGFSFSIWLKLDQTGSGGSGEESVTLLPLVSKHQNQTLLFSISVEINDDETTVLFRYRPNDLHENVKTLKILLDRDVMIVDAHWHHLVVTYTGSEVVSYIDGEQRGRLDINTDPLYDVTNDNTIVRVGTEQSSDYDITYEGIMQDVRVYLSPLSPVQIRQLFHVNAHYDVTPISGYLQYSPGEKLANISIFSVDDSETETNESFVLLLLDATGGAEVNMENMTSEITVLKSDNSNGLFGFTQPCQPDHVTEGESVICYVTRSLGSNGDVTVHWRAGTNHHDDGDFADFEGQVEFLSGEREQYFELWTRNDEIPEIDEIHNITIVEALPHDGVKSSAPYSGASVDPDHEATFVTIRRNDKPNGVLQFYDGRPPTSQDNGSIRESSEPPIVHVTEESDHVTLMVVRAAGWFGHVTVEWRTRDGSAISHQEPRDFESTAGTLTLEDGQGHAFVDVKLLDDDVSELEKYFYVVLSSPAGGASLNNASRAKVVIEPSDDAFGVFKFNSSSLDLYVDEPLDGAKLAKLQVVRGGGDLGESAVSWRVSNNKDDDVTPLEGQIEFSEGQKSAYIEIEVLADDVPEFDERKEIQLTEVTRGSLGSAFHVKASITIRANDDPRGHLVFSPTSVSANESAGFANLTVKRLGGKAGTIRVYYKTIDTATVNASNVGIAVADLDFKNTSDSILIHENVTTSYVIIPLIDDVTPETEEVFFVQLISAELVSSGVAVPNSPRVGSDNETLMEVVIAENDSPHGVLEISTTSIRVKEDVSDSDVTMGFISVVRKLGLFGDVTVGLNVVPGLARSQEDYNLIASEVTLLDGESSKPIPLRIVNDFTPELAEDFTVQLLPDSATGGARTGVDVSCHVTIDESDDPYGALEISVDETVVDEPPEVGGELPVIFTVNRRNGLRSVVAAEWEVFVEPAQSAASSGVLGSNPADDGGDVDVRSGIVNFISNETSQQFTVKILGDNLPEADEIVKVRLMEIKASYQGRIERSRGEASIVVKANDRPYGDVALSNLSYVTQEQDGDSTATLRILRSGGLYGDIRVVFSTSEVDLVSEMLKNDENLLDIFLPPILTQDIDDNLQLHQVDITSSENPQVTCAEACLREKVCGGFLFSSSSYECRWATRDSLSDVTITPVSGIATAPTRSTSRYSFFEKDSIKASYLYKSQAKSGMDFIPITGASLVIKAGQEFADIEITILGDKEPELDEAFTVQLLSVEVLEVESDQINLPLLLHPTSSRVTIRENDHPYGVFMLRSSNPDQKSSLEVEERSMLSLEMVVERKGGSVGDVTVEWLVAGGSAIRNSDFTGDDATLKFAHGETSKVISLTVLDDDIPEPDEDIEILLTNPSGGAVVSPSDNRTRVVILANDKVGGVVGFQSNSRSLIGQEGETVTLHLFRTEPALGSCQVSWSVDSVSGHMPEDGFNFTDGSLLLASGVKEGSIDLHLTPDSVPEVKEEYRVVLRNAESVDIPASGGAEIDPDASIAEISIQDSDDPHGVFQITPTSQRVDVEEEGRDIDIFISRRFGSIGRVRVYYDVIPGTLSTLNPDIEVADPGQDFTFDAEQSFVDFDDGVTSLPIVMQIIDDDIPELNEIFHVNLTRVDLISDDVRPILPPTISEGNSLAQVVINANDGTKGIVGFHADSSRVDVEEGIGMLRLRIVRDRGTYGRVTVFVFSQNRDAVIDEDFTCEPETIEFGDNQDTAVYDIEIIDDSTPEGAETFDVLLGNPSHGLQLGNVTRATVTIVSSDDAHGRLAFDNPANIAITEPELSNISNSKVELVVSRLPLDGVFGQISVQFKIERVTSSGDVTSDDVIDLVPSSGYVTIEDGIGFEVLEISAVADDFPELEECFRVTLFDPQHGATLNTTGTTTDICIGENDAPYGLFAVYPSASRNSSRDFRVRESTANHVIHFDVVRHQGDLGKVTVDVSSLQDSAVRISSSNNLTWALSPFQTFNGSGGFRFHSFHDNSDNYLIYLTSNLVRPITSPVGSRGTVTSLTPDIHSTLYVWRGVYVPTQTIETDGASDATTFTISDQLYIFICNSGESGRRETKSRLYKLGGDGKVEVLQNIDTKGATSVTPFTSDDVTYIFVTNSLDNNHVSSIDSVLFRFNEQLERLEQIQTLPTRGATKSSVFEMSGNQYLAIANRFDSEVEGNPPVMSVVYKWDKDSRTFVQRQSLDVSHANDVIHYDVGGQHFFIVSCASQDNKQVTSFASDVIEVFQVFVNDNQGHLIFRPQQTIPLTGINKLEIITSPAQSFSLQHEIQEKFLNENQATLLCASSDNASACFLFDHESQLFVTIAETISANHVIPHVVTSTLVVAMATNLQQTERSTDGNHDNALGFKQFSSSGVYDIINMVDNTTGGTMGDYVAIRNSSSLTFEPGVRVMTMAITLIDDIEPEQDERFQIVLGNSRDHRAVIDENSLLNVIIESNDDAHGVFGFDFDSLEKHVEETERDEVFTLNIRRNESTFGHVTIAWRAEGAINDVTPVSGQIRFEPGQEISSLQMSVLADKLPEVDESVSVRLFDPSLDSLDSSSSPPRLDSATSRAHVVILSNDSPHGVVSWNVNSLRTVINEAETHSEAQLVTLELLRSQGAMGDIEVSFKTSEATNLPLKSRALSGVDFIPRRSSLVMRENSTRAALSISIIPDEIPEDIESFYVIIDGVKLIGESEHSTKPGIGPPGGDIAEVTIDENDNSRGFIQFNVTRNTEGAIEAYELPRINNTLKIPLSRIPGLFRTVGVEWLARPETAKNSDFFPSSGSVQFTEGMTSSHIEILIADDDEVEFLETFTVQLVGTSGGAKLGGDLKVTVNILPNDSPSGMFGLIQLSQTLDESTTVDDPKGVVEFRVERFQGSSEDVTLLWELDESARFDLTPVSGKLVFPALVRSNVISLRSLPDQIVEGEEKFELRLTSVTGGAEISPVAGVAQVIIAANPGSAGVVRMQGCEDGLVMGEDEDRMLGVKLIRGPGLFGEVKVQWRLTPTDVNTFHNVQGEALFDNLQNETTIVIETIDDNIPEVTEEYNLQIVAATGGAEIDASLNTCRVTVTSSDSPHGTFQFSQPVYHVKETDGMSHDNIHQSVTDTSSFAKVTVIRNNGHMGEVEVFVQTSPGSATPNVDYYPVNKKLLFTNAEKFKDINIEIIDDNVPEGPNDFHVNITDVTFLTSDLLPHDSPPKLGDVTRSLVRIAKSDGAEGSVEFRDEMMEVDEDAGIARVVLVRNGGSYGSISVTLNSLNQTARRNVDFLLPSDGFIVEFKDDQQVAEASIRIVDDDEMEEEEKFTLIISDVAGGARMGGRLLTEVVIRKSDFPNGLLEFVGDNHVTVANPGVSDGPTQLKFYIERRGGNRLLVAARWRVSRTSPYISPTTSASALEPDIARPYTGTFNFADNEGGQKEITVTVLPHGGAEEVEENFMISVEGFYPAELSRTKGNVTIVVAKKGHPNGVVKFADSAENMETNEPSSGLSQLVFPLKRTQGTVGDVNVTWVVRPINAEFGASLDDVDKSTGLVQIYAGQSDAELIVNINEDLIPEIDEKFQVRLDGVIGGAELDTNNIVKEFTINANDDPHGVFGVFPSDQLVRVDDNMKRLLQVNVTRQKGTFGQVVVGFKIKFDVPDSGMSYLTTNTGTVTFTTATKWAVEEISIRSSANLQVGDMFVIELTSVELLDGDSAEILPSILTQFSKTFVEVPPQAGNPQMGFDPTISHVTDVSRDMCKVRLLRTGLFGPVTVHWASGYPMRREPEGFTHGRTLPSSGVVTMDNLQEEANISVRVLPSNDHRNLFAIHITRVHSSLPGGASMLSHRDVAEIDPCGAVRFADFSQRVTVTGKQLNLTVERLYGSRYDIIIHYVITPLTAHPGVDYVPSDDAVITMKSGEVEANIDVTLMTSSVPQLSKQFIVNLTMTSQPQDIYAGLSPRIIENERVSHVTIAESRDARGVISFDDVTIETNESGRDGGQVHVLMLNIRRQVGLFGDVSVMVSSFGEGETLDTGVQDSTAPSSGYIKRRIQTDRTKQASAGLDYEVRPINVTFQDGQSEATIPVVVLDDEMSEPDEAFFLYLHSATGGARVDDVNGIVKILIQANDLPNGKIGFESENFVLDEDSPSRSVDLKLVRSHAFGDVTVHWRAVESLPTGDDNPTTIPTVTSSVHHHDAKMLNEQIEVTSGDVTCHEGQFDCYITITMKHDELAEFSDFFFVILDEVSYGAEIDETRSVANLAILDSDSPHGKFLFTLSSRLPVVTKGTKSVGLTVQRSGGDSTVTSLRYSTRQLRRVVTVAGVTLYPAVEDVDYKQKDGSVEFEAGQREAYLTFDLVTESASTNPLPQIFQVVLDWSSGSSEISDAYHVANVTIVRSDESKKVWGVYEALQQDLDDSVVQGILTQLSNFAEENLNGEQLSIFHGCLDRIINEGRTRRLPQAILQQIYELFCKLLDPYRLDAVHGYSPFSSSFDEFALCLTSQSDCVSDDVTARSMTSCSHVMVQSFRSFPELINGYSFQGGGGNFFKLPIDLLDVNQHGVDGRNPKCFDVYFVEYSSQLWFEVNGEKGAMSNKIFSVGVDGKNIHTLTSPVKYRVYTKDLRISPKGAECVLWNEASSRWLLDPRDLCQVVNDDSNFVECECRHMSVYAARGPTDNLAGYNEATYAACFIAMVGSLLTVLGHHLCSKKSTFAAKLMMHMYFACAMTQLMFVIGALTSNQLSEESCAALAIFLHYFWLAQFTWIFMQSINILQVLAFNNENTDRLYILHFTLGWGIPSIVILLYVIIMYALGSKSLFHSYGDVHQNGDMCMIMNIYGVLLGAVTPAALCLVVTIAVGVVLYQRDVGWKQFDDLFRGRYNSVEIPLLFLSFFLIAFTWLWGGIHLAFGHMWALVLFIVSNFIQGFYFLIAYGILHNEVVRPTKAVYQETPIKNAQGPQHVTYAGSATYGSSPPSVSGDVHNKSTQSIAQHFEKGGWENPGLEVGDESLDEDGEDAEFDDLMFALNNSARVGLDDIEETRLASNPPSVGNRSVSSQNSVSNKLSCPVPNTTNTKSLPIHDTHL